MPPITYFQIWPKVVDNKYSIICTLNYLGTCQKIKNFEDTYHKKELGILGSLLLPGNVRRNQNFYIISLVIKDSRYM